MKKVKNKDRIEQDRYDMTGQDMIGQDRTGQDRTGQDGAWCSRNRGEELRVNEKLHRQTRR